MSKVLTPLLDTIKTTDDLRRLPVSELDNLCAEIRSSLIDSVLDFIRLCLIKNAARANNITIDITIIIFFLLFFIKIHQPQVVESGDHQPLAYIEPTPCLSALNLIFVPYPLSSTALDDMQFLVLASRM